MTLADYQALYYGAKVLRRGTVMSAVAAFGAATEAQPALAGEARARLVAIDGSLAGDNMLREGEELKKRDFVLWIEREALRAVVGG